MGFRQIQSTRSLSPWLRVVGDFRRVLHHSTSAQPSSGQGRFRCLLFRAALKRNASDSRSANHRCVRKLPCTHCLLVIFRLSAWTLMLFLFFFGSVGRQVPMAVRMGCTRVSDLESPLPLGTSIPLLVLGEV